MPILNTGLLDRFHPLVGKWFSERFAAPTAAQSAAWPKIAAGSHVLITAPTGSGKTLTAFLYAIDKLVSGVWSNDRVRVLYVSPLKALNNDIRRNLNEPIAEIGAAFARAGQSFPEIRVMTRSGDTPESERRSMAKRPPAILITTPESLNILLTSKRGSDLLCDIRTVILDEVHAVADGKRGTHLMCAVERLAALSGEFQRIALSATVNPPSRIAAFVGGRRLIRERGGVRFEDREVVLVQPAMEKSYQLRVSYLLPPSPIEVDEAEKGAEPPPKKADENPMWRAAAEEMVRVIQNNRTVLVFANSRRGVERTARLINEIAGAPLVFAHHGSLSREIREVVEGRLKAGTLKGVAATNSLELGIDVGAVDEVVLLETPPSIASFIQRLGRAGHRVGEVSRGRLLSLHPQDLLNAAVCAQSLMEREPEPISPPMVPLDVLAQVILSMTAQGPMRLDDVYDAVRAADPYAALPRHLFDLVVEMAAGKYEGVRIPALRPRLAVDRIDGTAEALPGAVRALYSSGGTIPDRGYFGVRIQQSNTKIGELDEEFVWERKLGDVITLGVQSWRIEAVGDSDVFVTPHSAKAAAPPFWTCEERGTGAYFALKRSALLEQAEKRLGDPDFREMLMIEHCLDGTAADELIRYLKSQKEVSEGALPHRRQVVVEHVLPGSHHRMVLTVLHTEWGGKVNRPYAIALSAALSEKTGEAIRVVHDDIALVVASETYFAAADLMDAVSSSNARALVKAHIRETGFFGANFRENAARSLLILKAGFGKRTPLWLNRKRAKELRAALSNYPDFPVTLETYRACLNDEMDLAAFENRLSELEDGAIRVREVTTKKPSPFAEPVLFKLSNELVYENDALKDAADGASALVDTVLFSDALRPKISRAVVRVLSDKLQRIQSGYAPSNAAELLEWIKERIVIPEEEWRALLAAMERDHGIDGAEAVAAAAHRAVALVSKNGPALIVAIENLSKLACLGPWVLASVSSISLDGSDGDPAAKAAQKKMAAHPLEEESALEDLLLELMRFCGPLSPSAWAKQLRVSPQQIEVALSYLVERDEVIVDRITEDAEGLEACHVDIFRSLLRMTRAAASRSVETRPVDLLPLFVAARQKIVQRGKETALEEALEPLFGFAATAAAWEQDILPARIKDYRATALDALLAGSNLQWTGQKDDGVIFNFSDDRELFFNKKPTSEDDAVLEELFPDASSRCTTAEVAARRKGATAGEIETLLFDLVSKERLTANTFRPLRLGRLAYTVRRAQDVRKLSSRWNRTEVDGSLWVRLRVPERDRDALEEEFLGRDRVRVLLDRYGVLFRELLDKEIAPLKWSSLFRTLRIMELSGEVIGGRFFEGVRGIQFIAKDALGLLQEEAGETPPVFWINAKDPASLCGVKVEGVNLPPRVQGTHLVYCGKEPVLVSKRNGKNVTFYKDPDDPRLLEYLEVFSVLLNRDQNPLPGISIEKINEQRAWKSPYRSAFDRLFDTNADFGSLQIHRRY